MKSLHMLTFVLLVIGGLNWLLHAFGYNLVDKLLGVDSTAAMVVYILVGLSAIHQALTHKNACKACVPSANQI